MSGDSIRVVQPLFPVEGEGSIPISPLQLKIDFIDRKVFKALNKIWHSRLPICANCFEGFCFGAHYKNIYYAVAWWTKPIASNRIKNGLKILELRRMAIHNSAPKNTASRFLSVMTKMIKNKNPEIFKLISYQDTEVHLGTIYKASGWVAASETNFVSWKNRKDYNRIDQSTAPKVRWEKQIRKEPPCQENISVDTQKVSIKQLEIQF